MREANRDAGRIDCIVTAVEALPAEECWCGSPSARRRSSSSRASPVRDRAPEHLRLHAIATQLAVPSDRIAREVRYKHRDRLMVTALLHDIGKLVLADAYPGYPGSIYGDARTPEERVLRERRELVVDHALVGGALARRWGLPDAIATGIERHHSEEARGDAAFVRLADLLAHFAQGDRVPPGRCTAWPAPPDSARTSCARSCATCPTRTPTARARSTSARSQSASAGARAPRRRQLLQQDRRRARPADLDRAHPPDKRLPQA